MIKALLVALGIAVATVATVSFAQSMGIGGGMHRNGMGGMMGAPPSAGENPLSATEAVIAKGKALFTANCAVCHGKNGRGDGPAAAGLNPRPPDLQGRALRWSDGQLAAQILKGRGNMPGFAASLGKDDAWRIVHYLRQLRR